jgi:hypothetical protein
MSPKRAAANGARTAAALAVAATCCLAALAAPAQANTMASLHASFFPDRLGASTAVTLAFRFSGGEEGVPAPLTGMVVRMPAGLGIKLGGVRTCPKSRLLSRGAAGCPSGSLVGRGHALLTVHAGSQVLPEEVAISVFRGPNRGGRPSLEIFGQGETPLDRNTLSVGVFGADSPPYGSKVTISIPLIPTVMFEPDASFVTLSLTIGGAGRSPRAHTAAGAVVVPRSCPAGGFPFAAAFSFADQTTASATARVTCP